jgi:hypothetical protein
MYEVAQQPSGSILSYKYGCIADNTGNLTVACLDSLEDENEEENTNVCKFRTVDIIHWWFLYTTFYGRRLM